MNRQEAIARIESAPGLEKAMRRYFYIILGGSAYGYMNDLEHLIMKKFSLDPYQFLELMQQASERWSLKIERCTAYLMAHPVFKTLIADYKSTGKGISAFSAEYLGATLLCYILEHVSLDNGDNRLKKKDAQNLIGLLSEGGALHKYLKVLFSPILECMKGTYTPFSQDYLQTTRMAGELCADYYTALYIHPDAGMRQLCLDTFKEMKKMDLTAIERFNYGLSEEELSEHIGRINLSASMRPHQKP